MTAYFSSAVFYKCPMQPSVFSRALTGRKIDGNFTKVSTLLVNAFRIAEGPPGGFFIVLSWGMNYISKFPFSTSSEMPRRIIELHVASTQNLPSAWDQKIILITRHINLFVCATQGKGKVKSPCLTQYHTFKHHAFFIKTLYRGFANGGTSLRSPLDGRLGWPQSRIRRDGKEKKNPCPCQEYIPPPPQSSSSPWLSLYWQCTSYRRAVPVRPCTWHTGVRSSAH
jgi:hypothetical protein